jgi:hypothetical protein
MNFNIIYTILSCAFFLVTLIFIGIKFKRDDERYYPLFVFLYYFIGAFKLNLFLIPIPLGFFICLIYLRGRPYTKNKQAKQAAIALGLLAFILGCVIPFVHVQILSHTRTINVTSWNASNFRFSDEYEATLRCLGSEATDGGPPTLTSFQVKVDKNNNITAFNYTLSFPGNTYQSVYVYALNTGNHSFIVRPQLKEQAASNNQLISFIGSTNMSPNANAKMFFNTLDALKIDKLKYTDVDENEFTLGKTLAYVYLQQQPAEVYLIEGNSFHLIEDKGQKGNILNCMGITVRAGGKTAKTKSYLPFY